MINLPFGEEIPYEEDNKELPYQTKLDLWETSFGLQAVDGLVPSKYMLELAEKNLSGKKSYEEIANDLNKYYEDENKSKDSKEADVVSLRIAEFLSDDYFTFSPGTLLAIHKYLFTDVFSDFPVGKFRRTNIRKTEEVLNGDSVQYASHFMIKETLDYDFNLEKEFSFKEMTDTEIGHHVMNFISNIWQIHPFREGNTRTMAVFSIKYLRSLGFHLNNEPFKKNSAYFRDALVLANASRELKTDKFLRDFTENLLFHGENHLSQRNMMKRTYDILKKESSDLSNDPH